MLKLATAAEERAGGFVMDWWQGDGAARVLAHADPALLLERAQGARSLVAMARCGEDDQASRIICAVADRLHAPRAEPPPDLVPLDRRFRDLAPAAAAHGGILHRSAALARDLLARPVEPCVLHGDLHHGNVLDGGPRGWLAIDPKGLSGARAFDYANLFCNPTPEIALAPGRLARRVELVATAARLDRSYLLAWVVAWAGLSAAWHIADGTDPGTVLAVATLASSLLPT